MVWLAFFKEAFTRVGTSGWYSGDGRVASEEEDEGNKGAEEYYYFLQNQSSHIVCCL